MKSPAGLVLGFLSLCFLFSFSLMLADTSPTNLHESATRLVQDVLHQDVAKPSSHQVIPSTIIRDSPHDEYLAVCLYVQNQAQDLPEWFIHHYYQMNIRRFYVMDDGSDPPMSQFVHTFGIPEEAIDFVYRARDPDAGSQSTQL